MTQIKIVSKKVSIILFILLSSNLLSQERPTKERIVRSYENIRFTKNGVQGIFTRDSVLRIAAKVSYRKKYKNTPFISKITFATLNTASDPAFLNIYLCQTSKDGKPSSQYLTQKQKIEIPKGHYEGILELEDKIALPEDGIFVIIENDDENEPLGASILDSNQQVVQPYLLIASKPKIYSKLWTFKDNVWIQMPNKTKHPPTIALNVF